MTLSNGNIVRVTGHLCGEFTGPRWISPHKGQWRGALMFSLMCVWINDCVNNREAGDMRRYGAHYDVIVMFKRIFLNENVRISIEISLKFVLKGPINNIPALVQIMAWRRSGDKPLSEPMMVSLLTHICVTRPQWASVEFMLPLTGHLDAESLIKMMNPWKDTILKLHPMQS